MKHWCVVLKQIAFSWTVPPPCSVAVWLGLWNSDHVVLKFSIRSLVLSHSVVIWLGFWNSDYVVLKLSILSSALPRLEAVWIAFWNSDHVVLKSSIRTSASPWRQRSDWGLRVTQNAYFSLMTHTKQLLLVTFCYTTAGIGASFRTDARRTADGGGGRTDRRGSRNSYLDISFIPIFWHVCMFGSPLGVSY